MLTANFDAKGNLVITIACDQKATKPSASGKSFIVASSNGNQATTLQVNGKPVVIGLNAYVKA